MEYYCDEIFQSLPLKKAEYEDCSFQSCQLSEQHLSGFLFSNCTFKDCDLSNLRWKDTKIQDCFFENCKMIGLHFEELSSFGLQFELNNCRIDHSSFYGLDLRNCRFSNCRAHSCDFSAANMQGLNLKNCDWLGANFENTQLQKTSWEASINLRLKPEEHQLKGASFEESQLSGLLSHLQIKVIS